MLRKGHREQESLENGISRFILFLIYFNLILNGMARAWSAYQHRSDTSKLRFGAFVYFGYFLSDYCLEEYRRLPPRYKSLRKMLLKFALWVFPSVVLLSFAYQIGTFANLIPSVLLYGVACSACFFYVRTICDDAHSAKTKQIDGGDDDNFKQISSVLEIV